MRSSPALTRALLCAALFYTAINNSFAVYGRFAFAAAGVLTALEEVTPSDGLCNNLQELVMDTNDLAIMLSRDAVTCALTFGDCTHGTRTQTHAQM